MRPAACRVLCSPPVWSKQGPTGKQPALYRLQVEDWSDSEDDMAEGEEGEESEGAPLCWMCVPCFAWLAWLP